jgi:hypothetical protein
VRYGIEMKRRLILMLLIPFTLIIIASYIIFGLEDCPKNNDVALEQYRNNRPVLSNQFIVNDNQKAVADILVPLWFVWFKSPNADLGIRLKDFEIHRLEVGKWEENKFLASVTFSVKPVKCSYEEWLTGNGTEAGSWVRNKFLFFKIIKEGDNYRVDSVGSGP